MNKYENAIRCLQVMKGVECINMLGSEFPEHYGDENIKALELAIEVLKKNRWIPCSERLPEKNKAVLVYVLDAYEIAYLDDAEDWIHCMGTFYKDEVEAWMPLPPAYKDGE